MAFALIYTLNNWSKKKKAWLINSMKTHNKEKKRVREINTFVKESRGIEYTIKKITDYNTKALAILDNSFVQSKAESPPPTISKSFSSRIDLFLTA